LLGKSGPRACVAAVIAERLLAPKSRLMYAALHQRDPRSYEGTKGNRLDACRA
jgi:hypothetical protein